MTKLLNASVRYKEEARRPQQVAQKHAKSAKICQVNFPCMEGQLDQEGCETGWLQEHHPMIITTGFTSSF
jgi:hypothetical protein